MFRTGRKALALRGRGIWDWNQKGWGWCHSAEVGPVDGSFRGMDFHMDFKAISSAGSFRMGSFILEDIRVQTT